LEVPVTAVVPIRRTREARLRELEPLLAQRILVLDGAMGTMIQSYHLGEREYRGDRFADWPRDLKGNNDLLSLTQPEIIRAIHRAYLDAGADILETTRRHGRRGFIAISTTTKPDANRKPGAVEPWKIVWNW